MASRTRGLIFFNPSSGVGFGPPEIVELQDLASDALLDVIEVTPSVNIRKTIETRMEQGQRLFVAAGGDGTINHVAQALVTTEAVLGILPVGTLNHFARDLGIPLGWREALDVAARGATRQIDTGKANHRYFLNNISLGLYPEVVEKREEQRARGRWKAFAIAGYYAFKAFPHVSINVETDHFLESIKTHLFMVSNNPYDLSRFGAEAPRVTLEGGQLSVYWLPHGPRIEFARVLARFLRGKIDAVGGLRVLRTRSVKVQTSHGKIRLGMDGELIEMRTPLLVQSVPASLLVKVPWKGM